ncbi:MAG: hypothetical protein HYV09_40035 [Deltaproteobacteria bacterium]|nr:hypothetical protein [Deltaproteobacteria bacterium]
MKTTRGAVATALCVLSLAMGCSDDSPATVTDTGVGVTDTGSAIDTATAGDAADACAPITNVGTVITKTTVSSAPPTMTGGTIVDGTYVLTNITKYNGVVGSITHKETMLFSGGNGQNVDSADGGPDKHTYFKYTTSGSELTMTVACGGAGSLKIKYTATPTTFTLITPDDPNESHTYTKK